MIKPILENGLLDKAANGDVSAQKQVGLFLCRNEKTRESGLTWLKKAAANDPDAAFLLGKVYLRSYGDNAAAISCFQQAAERGHVDAMVDLGACYFYGFHVEKNWDQAIKWYQKAASLGSAVAIHNLGYICLHDEEMYETALHLFQKAASRGYANAASAEGFMHLNGMGTPKDASRACACFALSYELGNYNVCQTIGNLYYQGVFDEGVQNVRKAIEWYEKGEKEGIRACIEVLGALYFHGFGIEADPCRAYGYYQKAAEMGSPEAAFSLASMYISGNGAEKDLKAAYKWMLLAQKWGNPKAERFVKMLDDILNPVKPAAAKIGAGGDTGVNMRHSYSAISESIDEERRIADAEKRKREKSLYAAAGAISGTSGYVDYDLGAVVGDDGEMTFVDADLGIIIGADGSVSSHDAKTGMTYNYSTGDTFVYDGTFNTTVNLSSGNISYLFDGFSLS